MSDEELKKLEELIATIKNMQLSEEMKEHLARQEHLLKVISLVNSMSDKSCIDVLPIKNKVTDILRKKEEIDRKIKEAANKAVTEILIKKEKFDREIAEAVNKSVTVPINKPTIISIFNYENCSGGIRITAFRVPLKKLVKNKNKQGALDARKASKISPVEMERRSRRACPVHFAHKIFLKVPFSCFDAGSIDVVIPEEIDGLPVVEIGDRAFEKSPIGSVVLPQSIVKIGDRAFYECSELREINMPCKLKIIGESAFYSCKMLDRIKLSETITKIGSYAFAFTGLKNIFFNVEEIPMYCFKSCKDLSISIGKRTKKINAGAFYYSTVKRCIIPENVLEIDCQALAVCGYVAVLGMNTKFDIESFGHSTFYGNSYCTVYCSSGSTAQQQCRKDGVTAKPLSEYPCLNDSKK